MGQGGWILAGHPPSHPSPDSTPGPHALHPWNHPRDPPLNPPRDPPWLWNSPCARSPSSARGTSTPRRTSSYRWRPGSDRSRSRPRRSASGSRRCPAMRSAHAHRQHRVPSGEVRGHTGGSTRRVRQERRKVQRFPTLLWCPQRSSVTGVSNHAKKRTTLRSQNHKWVLTLQKWFLFNHTTPFLTKGLEKSLCSFTGTTLPNMRNLSSIQFN